MRRNCTSNLSNSLSTFFILSIKNHLQTTGKVYCSTLFVLINLGLLLFNSSTLSAQDKHFTQYYAAPMSVNPALTGAFQGKYRIGIVRRDQWRNALESPYLTFAGGIDLRFNTSYKKRKYNDAIGVGVLFFNDKVDDVGFRTTQMALSTAYHKALDQSGTHYLTLGMQMAINQRSINYENLTFEDQYDGTNGYSLGTGEALPENNFSYSDLALGLNYTFTPNHRTTYFLGASMHHVFEPNVSFLAANADEQVAIPDPDYLHRKYSGQIAARLPLGDLLFLTPRVLFSLQGPHLEINAGTNFRISVGDYNPFALHIGGWIRPVKNADQSISVDAVVGMLGIEYQNLLFGFSYDLNIDDLALSLPNRSSFEISIAYLGNFENEEILCPKF